MGAKKPVPVGFALVPGNLRLGAEALRVGATEDPEAKGTNAHALRATLNQVSLASKQADDALLTRGPPPV